jgi:hypothetical protein
MLTLKYESKELFIRDIAINIVMSFIVYYYNSGCLLYCGCVNCFCFSMLFTFVSLYYIIKYKKVCLSLSLNNILFCYRMIYPINAIKIGIYLFLLFVTYFIYGYSFIGAILLSLLIFCYNQFIIVLITLYFLFMSFLKINWKLFAVFSLIAFVVMKMYLFGWIISILFFLAHVIIVLNLLSQNNLNENNDGLDENDDDLDEN